MSASACCWMEPVSLMADITLVTQISTRDWLLWLVKNSGLLEIS